MSEDKIATMHKAKELQALKNANKKLVHQINLLTNQINYYKSLVNHLQEHLHAFIQASHQNSLKLEKYRRMELTLESLNVLDPFEIPQEYEPCKFSENPILNDLIDKDASPDNAFYTPETI